MSDETRAAAEPSRNLTPQRHVQATIDPKVLNILVCPKTHGPLIYDRENAELISKKAKLAYPVRDGVPILLIEEARAL